MQEHGLQCGFCTPGMMMTSYALLEAQPEPERGRDPPGDLRQPLPLHRLRQHRQGRAARGREARGKEGSDGHDTPHHPRSRRHGPLDQAQGRPALHPRPGQLRRRRHSCPGCSTWTSCAAPTPTRRSRRSTPTKALKIPGVLAVITGETLAKYKLHWMPTLMSDTQMVLPIEKVMYQAQEVAAVIATDRYTAADGVAAVEVEYEPLPVVVDPFKALEPGAPVLRTDKPGKKDNHIFHWEVGRPRRHRQGLHGGRRSRSSSDIYIPRIHVASIETCGCVAALRQGPGQAHGLDDHPGAARDPHGLRAGGRATWASRRRRSASSRPTSAAASAARCRSIPATSSRWRPRS